LVYNIFVRRWLIISGIILVGAIIALSLWALNRDERQNESARIVDVEGEWKNIDHPTFGISFKAPLNWDVNVYGSGNGQVTGQFRELDTVGHLDIGLVNASTSNAGELLSMVPQGFSSQVVEQNELSGISYFGKVLIEGDVEGDMSTSLSPDSYFGGRLLVVDSGIVDAKCLVVGTDYSSYISVCNSILNSIKGL